MSLAQTQYITPVTRHNAKLVVTSGKVTVVPEPSHNMTDIGYGVLIGLVPGVPAFLTWIGSLIKAGIARKEKLDDGFIEYLREENLSLRDEMKQLRHDMSEMQIAVGTNQQKIVEFKAKSKVVEAAADTITKISEEAHNDEH